MDEAGREVVRKQVYSKIWAENQMERYDAMPRHIRDLAKGADSLDGPTTGRQGGPPPTAGPAGMIAPRR